MAGCAPASALSFQLLASQHCTSNIVALVEQCVAEYQSITLDAPAISVQPLGSQDCCRSIKNIVLLVWVLDHGIVSFKCIFSSFRSLIQGHKYCDEHGALNNNIIMHHNTRNMPLQSLSL